LTRNEINYQTEKFDFRCVKTFEIRVWRRVSRKYQWKQCTRTTHRAKASGSHTGTLI